MVSNDIIIILQNDWSNEWTWFEMALEVPKKKDGITDFHSDIFLLWCQLHNNESFHYLKNLHRIIAINAFSNGFIYGFY